jgi:mono/diheme cytochrome c family protein
MHTIVVAAGLLAAFGFGLLGGVGSQADEIAANPYLGKATAIDEGRQIYRSKCISCHGRAGGRGPNLFESGISELGFVRTVLKGRSGTGMPAFRARLSEDEVFKLRAFIESTDQY